MSLLKSLHKPSGVSSDNKVAAGRIVEYEQHSKPLLAIALVEKRGKWLVVNQSGGELELPVDRLTLLPGMAPGDCTDTASRSAYLGSLLEQTLELESNINLEDVWSVLVEDTKDYPFSDIVEIQYPKSTLVEYLAFRRVLLSDQVFFKRKKIGFEPRPASVVEELKVKVRVEGERQARREQFVATALSRLQDESVELPPEIAILERLALFGKSADDSKESLELLERIVEKGKLSINGRPEDRAFKLLVALKHFTPDHNLLPLRFDRPLVFEQAALQQVEAIRDHGPLTVETRRRDLRELFTFTIDGEDTRDFDDALSYEEFESGCRVGIHISDVASFIEEGSPLDDALMRRGTSIYCPDEQIPMLPPSASEDIFSLIEGTERYALSFFIELDEHSAVRGRTVESTLIRIAKRLSYADADRLMCDEGNGGDPKLQDILLKLWNVSGHSESARIHAGALQLNRRELTPKVMPDGRIILEESTEDKPGRKLVSEMMILANETAALYAVEHGLPMLFRGQEPPDVDIESAVQQYPEGPAREYYRRSMLKRSTVTTEPQRHSGLGLTAYVQSTSPIRRAADLFHQRQLLHSLEHGAVRYPPLRLLELLALLDTGLDEAYQIQRARNRYWMLKYLLQENIKELGATIIRVDGAKPLAELDLLCSLQPYHPIGSKADTQNRKQIGRRITLRIDSIDPRSDTLVLREID